MLGYILVVVSSPCHRVDVFYGNAKICFFAFSNYIVHTVCPWQLQMLKLLATFDLVWSMLISSAALKAMLLMFNQKAL